MTRKGNDIAIGNALLRFYHRIEDPSVLTDEEWSKRVQEINFCLDQEAQRIGKVLTNILVAAFGKSR